MWIILTMFFFQIMKDIFVLPRKKNFAVLEHPMLHSNFQGHRPFGSGAEEDF